MAAGAAVPQHRDVRSPAHPGVRCARAGARRLAARTDELGALVRRDRPLPRALRRARRCPGRARGDRAQASPTSSALVAAGVPDGATVLVPEIDFTLAHVAASSPRGGSTCGRRRSTGSPMPSTPARTSSRSAPSSPLTALSPISTRSPTAAADHGTFTRRRRLAGSQLAADRRLPVRRRRLRRLQVAHVAARHGVPRAVRPRARADTADRGQLVRRRRPLRQLLPRTIYGLRRTPAGSTSHRRGSPGSAPSRRCACSREIGVDAVHEHDVGLANRFRAGLGLPAGDSAIVSTNLPDAEERLERAGIRAAVRGGALRASFHVYNTEADVDAALSALLD